MPGRSRRTAGRAVWLDRSEWGRRVRGGGVQSSQAREASEKTQDFPLRAVGSHGGWGTEEDVTEFRILKDRPGHCDKSTVGARIEAGDKL